MVLGQLCIHGFGFQQVAAHAAGAQHVMHASPKINQYCDAQSVTQGFNAKGRGEEVAENADELRAQAHTN